MKVNLEKIEKNTAYLNFEVDAEQLEKAIQQAYKKNVKRFAIPGFRRGKAPRKLIEMHYGPEVFYEEAMQILLPEVYQKGVEEYKLQPVDQPKFDVQQIETGKPLLASAEVVVKPEVKIEEYKGLEVEKVVHNVTEDEVEKQLLIMQEKNARLVAVEDKAAEGDIAIIDFEGSIDNEPFEGGKAENYPLQLGSGMFIKGFEEQVIGMMPGETKDISVTFPEDYNAEELAGKNAVFTVTLKELKRKELLPLDDDFAKDVSEFDTLAELKEDIKNKLQLEAKSVAEDSLRASIIDKLIEKAEVDIPEVMINQEVDNILLKLAINLKQSTGYDLTTYLESTGMTLQELRDRYHDVAVRNVKTSLVLEEIGKLENITVTDEELDNKIKELAEMYKKPLEEYEKSLSPENKESIKDLVLTEKIFDFLIENSNIIEKVKDNTKDDTIEAKEADIVDDESDNSEKTV
ncbi:Trigger factor [Tepidanaerobacter acetatoxydans Re1]|uniref:Trigger factor n=2 Tax=Tepidanaerobacter acetatoxydans TaxID=499229 RepID=F4LVU5_TEPAE|nr:trigger factor [Tepidanaerobacter acetatoxydans]AEE90792.1 Trigger factor [Tepidanaerobacter acetatoxydans Re1]CCP25348.1 Trigger factor [Tepidanaerobacter acetatoxydans Re1]